MSVETHLLYAVHGPIVAALLVSLLDSINNPPEQHNPTDLMPIIAIGPVCLKFWMFSPAGEPVLLTEHHKSVGDQVERHSPGGVQHVHEGGESHPDPGAAPRDTVCYFPLEAGEPPGGGSLRVHHAHTHALPGGSRAGEGRDISQNNHHRAQKLFVVFLFSSSSIEISERDKLN